MESASPRDERPKLRPFLEAESAGRGRLYLHDTRQVGQSVFVDGFDVAWLNLCDGTRTIDDLVASTRNAHPELGLTRPHIEQVLQQLETACLLDGPAFRALMEAPIRPPSCLGCYEPEPDRLGRQLERLFTDPGGPGLPTTLSDPKPPRAVLVPHIDYARGGTCYGWGFRPIAERAAHINLFFIVGTSHWSPYPLTLTRKNFSSPLGVVETDQAAVDRIVECYGEGLFDDEVCHLPEHSIELEVVLLQYLRPQRPFRIVPLLVGSFHEYTTTGRTPADYDSFPRMVEALRFAEVEAGEPVGYIISGDLAHIGPKFSRRDPPALGNVLQSSREADQRLLNDLRSADPTAYLRTISAESDARRICGLPPTWLVLSATQPRSGELLDYRQALHPTGHESVSFASMVFES